MQTVADILDALEGPAAVARAIKIPLTTVIGWRDANFVPEWRRPALIGLAKRREKPLGDHDFPPIEMRVSRKERAA